MHFSINSIDSNTSFFIIYGVYTLVCSWIPNTVRTECHHALVVHWLKHCAFNWVLYWSLSLCRSHRCCQVGGNLRTDGFYHANRCSLAPDLFMETSGLWTWQTAEWEGVCRLLGSGLGGGGGWQSWYEWSFLTVNLSLENSESLWQTLCEQVSRFWAPMWNWHRSHLVKEHPRLFWKTYEATKDSQVAIFWLPSHDWWAALQVLTFMLSSDHCPC